MLIMSCPRALFESKFCITCSISFSVNVIFDKEVVKRELHYRRLSTIEHCLAKKEWNNLVFSLKFVANLFSWKIGGIQGIFYYYGKTLLLTNMFWDLRMVPLIFQINENNISPLTLQWNTPPPPPSKFWRDWRLSKYWLLLLLLLKRLHASFSSWIKRLIELLIQGGSLSSHVITSRGIKLCNIILIVLLNKWTMSLTFIFGNDFSHWKPLIAFLIWSTFAFLKCHISRSYRGGKTTLRLNLANTVWWWKVWCKEDWTPDSATKFGWEAKTESLQKDLSPIMWVGKT